VGRRGRQRERVKAPTTSYSRDGSALELRGSLTHASRREYAALAEGGSTREDTWHRAVEFLFERLAVSWTVSGVEWTAQKELLARFRVASQEEKAWVRDVLREHVAEWFPDVDAP
jgi:hypothetical protein